MVEKQNRTSDDGVSSTFEAESNHANASTSIDMRKRNVGSGDSTNGPTAKRIRDDKAASPIFNIIKKNHQTLNQAICNLLEEKENEKKILEEEIVRLEEASKSFVETKTILVKEISKLKEANCNQEEKLNETKKTLEKERLESKEANCNKEKKFKEEKEIFERKIAALEKEPQSEKKKFAEKKRQLEQKINGLEETHRNEKERLVAANTVLEKNRTKKTCAFCEKDLNQLVLCSNDCMWHVLTYLN